MNDIPGTGFFRYFCPSGSRLAGLTRALLAFAFFSFCHAESTGLSSAAPKWVGTWSTAPQLVEPGNNPPNPGLINNTLRQIVRVSIGGDSLRARFSNEFSKGPVTFHTVHMALSHGGGMIDSSTDRVLYFEGETEITIAPGAAVFSDPFPFALRPRMDVAITIYFGKTPPDITGHPGSRTTSYLITGNEVSTVDLSGAVTTDHWYNINAIDVLAPQSAACVAILGNSITDGRGSTTNMQNRWADVFSESLLQDSSTQHVGVLNLGIGGNSVLSGGLGPTGVSRFDRDILNQRGLRWAIVFEGVNDIGGVNSAASASVTASNLIAAYQQMIVKAHMKNIRIYGGTILPFNGSSYYNQYSELCRNTVNQWIRAEGNYDGCIDFDKAMRNPQDTTRLVSTYQNDGLHPDAAGYKTMGESIDLNLFTGSDTVFQHGTGMGSFWFEAERFPTVGSRFTVVHDAAACSTSPVTRSESHAASPTQALAPELRKASIDSVVQFLLTAAATDFHTHRPPDPLRFRDVHIGHVMTPGGEEQYMLCGQFLSAREGGKAEWTPFVTIKTSDYEQWIGGQAADFCRRSSVIWDKVGDLSSSLQSRLDSLR